MDLFFHVKPGVKRAEYEWNGVAWRSIPFGTWLVDLANAFFEHDLPRLEGMTGREGEEAVVGVCWPLLLLAGKLAGMGSPLEDVGYPPPGTSCPPLSNDLIPYLNGDDQVVWYEWLETCPRPLFVQGHRMGWACTADTTARAAAAEAVLGLMHGWKFRFCKACARFYTGKKCERCAAGEKEREDLLNLLAVHKVRKPEAAAEISRLYERVKNGCSLDAARADYKGTCKLYRIPTEWATGKKRKKK